MKEIQYKKFSWDTHAKNWEARNPNVCQFELTFRCGLHCKHCYTDCYNKPQYIKKELNTKEVKLILDKMYNAGVIWVCFTGGDPLTRKDFLEIYSYAKAKGFIVTIFTNGYSMTEKIAEYLGKKPPFVIEMTLNAVTEELYDKISQVKGSFEKVMKGIDLIIKNKIPLKIKTQITKDNFSQRNEIKKFIEGLGLEFRPSIDLYARLNGDLGPCALRLTPEEVLSLSGKNMLEDDCDSLAHNAKRTTQSAQRKAHNALFRCAIGGGDGVHIDPYGNTFMCNLIREPKINLLRLEVVPAQEKLLPLVRNRIFATNSKCKTCVLIESCRSCPGRAYLETGDMEAPLEYHCQLVKIAVK